MSQVNGAPDQRSIPPDEAAAENTNHDYHTLPADPLVASTSLEDSGQSKRPRDARLLHIILASLGVQAYQERVPLQLMDFAYRYTSSVLQDALHLTNESYGASGPGSKVTSANDLGSISLQSLRLAVASRQQYQFQSNLPKEHFQELALEKNKVSLPVIGKTTGIRLPPERYCLTGVGYSLQEEWEDDIDLDVRKFGQNVASHNQLTRSNGGSIDDVLMQGVERAEMIDVGDDEEMREG